MRMKLICLDFDDTILHRNVKFEYYTDTFSEHLFVKLLSNNYLICICSFNHEYFIKEMVERFHLQHLFLKIMGDKRPKNLQIRHILDGLSDMFPLSFIDEIIFIDDTESNLAVVEADESLSVTTIKYTKELFPKIIEELEKGEINWQKLQQ